MSEKNEKIIFDVAYQPQVRTNTDTRRIMLDVLLALVPAVIVSVINFGIRTLLVMLVSMAAAVFFEWAYRKLMKKPDSIGDLTAALTGLLLVLTMPPQTPVWMPIVGDLFAIVVVKQLYGGLGKNFLNPALAGRAFLMASYAAVMGSVAVDGVTMATPLSYMYAGEAMPFTTGQLFMGGIPGAMGEVSALALLIGGAYLIYRKVISWRIPVAFIGTVAIITFLFPAGGIPGWQFMLYELTTGGLMLGAIFMATDYVTSPTTKLGRIIYGVGCGLITVFIRYFGYPEGVSFAILVMNLFALVLDRVTMPVKFGGKKNGTK